MVPHFVLRFELERGDLRTNDEKLICVIFNGCLRWIQDKTFSSEYPCELYIVYFGVGSWVEVSVSFADLEDILYSANSKLDSFFDWLSAPGRMNERKKMENKKNPRCSFFVVIPSIWHFEKEEKKK